MFRRNKSSGGRGVAFGLAAGADTATSAANPAAILTSPRIHVGSIGSHHAITETEVNSSGSERFVEQQPCTRDPITASLLLLLRRLLNGFVSVLHVGPIALGVHEWIGLWLKTRTTDTSL